MATAYNPGLMVTERTLFIKERRLPLQGNVIVQVGDRVSSGDIIARTDLPGNVHLINLANKLNISPSDVSSAMLKKVGEKVTKDEIIAHATSFFGLFKYDFKSPITGTVENISDITGQVFLREPPIPVEISAYIDGVIAAVVEKEGADIRTEATYIQGIFGVGGEVVGPLTIACEDPGAVLDESKILPEHKGKIIAGGALVTSAAISKAISCGVKGIIVAGLDDKDLKEFLGYDLGVAITGNEEKGLTLVVTEGFGKIRMADKTAQLLKKCEGRKTSINGATQIRAGVIRPEIIIPHPDMDVEKTKGTEGSQGLDVGTPVRIIREPNFGRIAKVVSLPKKLQLIATEAHVTVAEIEFVDDHTRYTVPRANIEIIES